jgi:hypothetical protein
MITKAKALRSESALNSMERGGKIARMRARVSLLSLSLLVGAFVSVTVFAQTPTPSITLGTHVLTLGMQESFVLEQVGADFRLESLSGTSTGEADWMITKKMGSLYSMIGELNFKNHKLMTVERNWDIDEASSKSLFYAISEATDDLARDGLTNCHLSSAGASQMITGPDGTSTGSLNTRKVLIDCGVKRMELYFALTDSPGMAPSSMQVQEILQSR